MGTIIIKQKFVMFDKSELFLEDKKAIISLVKNNETLIQIQKNYIFYKLYLQQIQFRFKLTQTRSV